MIDLDFNQDLTPLVALGAVRLAVQLVEQNAMQGFQYQGEVLLASLSRCPCNRICCPMNIRIGPLPMQYIVCSI